MLFKPQQVRSRLHNKKGFATVKVTKHCNKLSGEFAVFILGDCRVCWKKLPKTTRACQCPCAVPEVVASRDPSRTLLWLHVAVQSSQNTKQKNLRVPEHSIYYYLNSTSHFLTRDCFCLKCICFL